MSSLQIAFHKLDHSVNALFLDFISYKNKTEFIALFHAYLQTLFQPSIINSNALFANP